MTETPIQLALKAKKGEIKPSDLPSGAANNLFRSMTLKELEAAAQPPVERKAQRLTRPDRFRR